MRRDVQEIFKMTPHEKQVMMFSATLSKEIRPVCKKFMQDVIMKAVLLFGFYLHFDIGHFRVWAATWLSMIIFSLLELCFVSYSHHHIFTVVPKNSPIFCQFT